VVQFCLTICLIFVKGWLYHIPDPPSKKQIPPGIEHAMSYFWLRSVILKTCSGSAHNHFQLERIKWCKECQLSPTLCELYQGNLRQWFTDLMQPTKAKPLSGCWRSLMAIDSATEMLFNMRLFSTCPLCSSSRLATLLWQTTGIFPKTYGHTQ
jgi:hypothetical protein